MEGIIYSQKQKLLVLEKILCETTDEENCLTVAEIIQKLGLYGIKVERKTVYDDIRILTDFGVDIVVTKKAHSNAYYVASHLFQDEELQILVDAVASSKFLTYKKSNELISKLATLTNKRKAKKLKRNIYVSGRVKAYNEMLYYNIGRIQDAIFTGRQITFRYYEYNMQKRKQLKHKGEWYKVSPYHLIWENDNYYLVCYCEKHQKICRYRVDRIVEVYISDEKVRELNDDEILMAKSLRSVYNMYGGVEEKLTVEFDKSLIGVVIDKYGENISVHDVKDNTFKVFLDVEVSPTFWGWLFQFGEKAKVIAPQRVVDQAKSNISNLSNNYNK